MKPALKIVAGGQTGVDRAALEWALTHGVPHGGWCPKGRRTEDGVIPPDFNSGKLVATIIRSERAGTSVIPVAL